MKRQIKTARMSVYRHLLTLLLFGLIPMLSKGQIEVSVPFPEGFFGAQGANAQQANNISLYNTLGIQRTFFIQSTASGRFEIQGNDVIGICRIQFTNGSTLDIPGTITWRVTSPGNVVELFGFIPRSTVNTSFTYGTNNTYNIVGGVARGNTNIGMKKIGSTLSLSNSTNVSGNAATGSTVLDELNAYLDQTISVANVPIGPVTATSQTTSDTTPTLTGTATLRTGETLQILIDGNVYTTSNGLSINSSTNTWSLTIPDGDALTLGNTYDVTAVITNSNGYTLQGKGTVTISNTVTAGTLAGNQTLCIAGTSTFSTSGTAGGTWTSSDPNVATVDASTGVVTAVAAGTATITYTVSGQSANRTVTVSAPPNAGTLSGTQAICVDATSQISSNGNIGGTWTSTDPTVATVSSSGLVTAVAAGSASIQYIVAGSGGCDNDTASIAITVTNKPTAGTISGTLSTTVGNTTSLSISGNSASGSWKSASNTIATVDANGVVSGAAVGVTSIFYIVAGSNGCDNDTATVSITITAAPTAGTLAGNQTLCIAGTSTFSTSGTAGGTWTSSDPNVATVDASTGVVTAVAAGTATITYTVSGQSA
ncbi:MAG: beta strand repeat-containing protein, partial [Spirosomataceae bacterium]